MDKHNAKTRKKLKQISSVKDFESLIEQTMLSEEEKKILWLHYKEQKTYSNKEKVCICVAQALPNVTSAQTVAITIGTGTTQYPLRTKCGNDVHADQIRSRRVYHTNVATDTASFVVLACELCKTGFNFPTIPATT